MFLILERYIAKTILLATLLTGFLIGSILFVLKMLSEFKDVGSGDFGLISLFLYVLLRLPNDLYHFSPMLILLGSMIGLSILSSHKELAIMRASGFSIQKIMKSVLAATFLITLFLSGIGESLAPNMSYKAAILRENAMNAGQAVVTGSGVWLHVDQNFIHIDQIVDRRLVAGVSRYQFDANRRLQVAYYAKQLSLINNQWTMLDGVKTHFYPERIVSTPFESAPWDLKLNPNLFNLGLIDPQEMSLSRLAKFSHYLEKNGLQAAEYQYEFWQRIFQPFAAMIMVFLAIPFVLSTLSAQPLSLRIVIGLLAGFVFFIANAFLVQICIVFQFPPLIAAILPLLGFGLLGIILSRVMITN